MLIRLSNWWLTINSSVLYLLKLETAESAHVMNIMGGALFSVPFLGEQKRDEEEMIKDTEAQLTT